MVLPQPWSCLPLIALQYIMKLNLSLLKNPDAVETITPTCEVWADYIYLDTDERRSFAQVLYLIEQLQIQEENSSHHSLN